MRTLTITIENVPEGIFNTIWEASIESAPKAFRRKIDAQPTNDIKINYGEGVHSNKGEIITCLTGLICTHIIMDLKKRGKYEHHAPQTGKPGPPDAKGWAGEV